MVQILQKVPGFGERLGAAIGGGLGQGFQQGISKSQEFAEKMKLQEAKKKQEDTGLKDRGIQSIEDMRNILSRGKTGWNFLNYSTEEGRADRAAMDTAALNLERLAVEMQGKGVLSKPRFEYMVKRLPSSSKSDAANNAILDEWEGILSGTQEEKKSSKSKKKKLTNDIIDSLLDETKGDIKKAKKLAADKGYTW